MRRARLKVEPRPGALRVFSGIGSDLADLLRFFGQCGFWGGQIHLVNKPCTFVNNI